MKKNYLLIASLLFVFAFSSFSQAGKRQAVIGIDRYRNLDLKKMEQMKIKGVTNKVEALTLLYSENFDQGGLPAGWSVTGNSTSCMWAVDATPNPPGYYSAPFCLNYNNGVNYDCGRNYGSATTPLLNVTPNLIQVNFQYIKDTETPEITVETFDMLYVSILDENNNILYTEAPVESNNWSSYSLQYMIPAGVDKIKVEFYFDTMDDLFNDYKGVFVDDLEIYFDPNVVPLSNWALFIGIFLVATIIIIRYRRIGG